MVAYVDDFKLIMLVALGSMPLLTAVARYTPSAITEDRPNLSSGRRLATVTVARSS